MKIENALGDTFWVQRTTNVVPLALIDFADLERRGVLRKGKNVGGPCC
jgi:hypothetical protein